MDSFFTTERSGVRALPPSPAPGSHADETQRGKHEGGGLGNHLHRQINRTGEGAGDSVVICIRVPIGRVNLVQVGWTGAKQRVSSWVVDGSVGARNGLRASRGRPTTCRILNGTEIDSRGDVDVSCRIGCHTGYAATLVLKEDWHRAWWPILVHVIIADVRDEQVV